MILPQVFLMFGASLVLLCLPTAWLCRNRVHFLPIENLMERPKLLVNWLGSVAWWNMLRAWAGVWLLHQAEFEVLGRAYRHQIVIGFNGLVLGAGLALQMFFYRTRENEVPFPISYGFGVLLAVLPPGVALPALALGVATSIAGRSFSVGWLSSGIVVGVLGFLLAVSKFQLAKAGLLFVVPLVAILGSNRHFVIPVGQRARLAVHSAFPSRLR